MCEIDLEKEPSAPFISLVLIDWYQNHKRDLPWRATQDPYKIWISEIILQQTRVAQGHAYYLRFIERFPDVASLAHAEQDEVLKLWQGLGYYSRARNLHAAAKEVMSRFDGIFPHHYDRLLSLKGIGEYTAAAISSFVDDQPYPVVDGNVFRVLSRLFDEPTPIDSSKGKRIFYELAHEVLDKQHPGLHNQAIMEFGALQCVPRQPDCSSCPLQPRCLAFANGRVDELPVKQGKTKTRQRFFHYLYIIYKEQTWLHRRGEKDIWEGLYEFPLIETTESMDLAQLLQDESFRRLTEDTGALHIAANPVEMKHILSHQIIRACFYTLEIERPNAALDAYLALPIAQLEEYAVPRLIHRFLEGE